MRTSPLWVLIGPTLPLVGVALAVALGPALAAAEVVAPAPRLVTRRADAPPARPPAAPMHLGVPGRDAVAPPPSAAMRKLSGTVWIEGPGFDVKYGMSYEACAQRCLAHARCVMIEYYRPERKCNMYDVVRPRKQGGSSDVAIRN